MADKEKIKASVIMSVYRNNADEIRKSISSVLSQDFGDFEFIICNDGSGDYVKKVIDEFGDNRIVYIENSVNKGLSYSLNKCIEISRSNWLIRQDCDDYSLESRFSETMKLAESGKYHIISSNIRLFDEKVWGKRGYPEFPSKNDFLFAIPYMHGACTLYKPAVVKAGMYSLEKAASRCEDYALFMKMYSQGSKGTNIQKYLYAFQESEKTIKRRSYHEKIQQVKVKAVGFKQLHLYPKGIIYLVKPLVVGLIPAKMLARIKDKHFDRRG